MQQKNPLLTAFLGAIVPFFTLYWLYRTVAEFRRRGASRIPSLFMLIGPIVVIIVLITAAGGPSSAGQSKGSAANFGLGVLLSLGIMACIMVLPVLFYYRFARAASQSVQEDITWTLLLMFLLFSPVGVYFTQDRLNKTANMLDAEQMTGKPLIPGSPFNPSAAPFNPSTKPKKTPPNHKPPKSPIS